jgi:DNA-3-methyladenine glycosylase
MNYSDFSKKLKKNFYTRDVLIVARELPGKILVKNENGKLYAGKIVEVEAYDGLNDEAAHTFIGKTERNKIMFEEGGYFYVYFTYGAHYCCNIVVGQKNHGVAILIRAVEPLYGVDFMEANRLGRRPKTQKEILSLTNGPGKLCQAFEINRFHNGEDLMGDKIYLLNAPKIRQENIVQTKRIGIKKSVDLPWRFYIKDNHFVSKK